jgi:hypothetical protein
LSQLAAFIIESHRPEINGGRLDKNHDSKFTLDYSKDLQSGQLEVNALVFGPKKDKVLLNLEYAMKS